jgi:diaminopimelate epimerase
MKFPFAKYVGCGNDFVIIDDREHRFPTTNRAAISSICHRQCGIGADGLILLQNAHDADFRMRIFNADGSEAEMCGNGIRTLMAFIVAENLAHTSCLIDTKAGKKRVYAAAELFAVDMGPPSAIQWDIDVPFEGQKLDVHFLNTGVPHAVLLTSDVANFDLDRTGRHVRNHRLFQPHGTNFNAVAIAEDGKVWNRTYERGVEAETLACGTGCVAAALVASYKQGLKSPISVVTKSGQELQVSFARQGATFEKVTMLGPANKTFEGSFSL